MRQCVSKYHQGNRTISDDMFTTSTARRCVMCARLTSSQYQRSELGKTTKQAHYKLNADRYKQTQRNSLDKSIELDGGVLYLFTTARRRAKRYGVPFTLEPSDVVVPSTCPVYGIPLVFSTERTENTPSLDRIDNTRGYVPGNVCVISWKANHKKRDLTVADIDMLYRYMKAGHG